MPIDPQLVRHALAPFSVLNHLYIGYSGGLDSHVLLHLCAQLPDWRAKTTAVYIHHGLQAAADDWLLHCQQTAQALNVGFVAIHVNAQAASGQSPEEAAREARYQAFKSLIGKGDVLLFAQHREDQLETVLLQLFRGSGLPGLSGMPERMDFGDGVLLRPLLDTCKQDLSDYAQAQQLEWVDDPSNFSNDYDRNYLRNAVIPLLKQRWPALDKTVARSARHCADAQQWQSVQVERLFLSVFSSNDNTLSIRALLALPETEQRLVVRRWFKQWQLKMPSLNVVQRIFSELIAAPADGDPQLVGQGYCLRRYRDKLYCLKGVQQPMPEQLPWPAQQSAVVLPDGRCLGYQPSKSGLPLAVWQTGQVCLCFRRGGEKISLPGRAGRHSLKNLYQEAGIPPWQRPQMPLLYVGDELAAVGDLWISAPFYQPQGEACVSLQWMP
ncbi:tRNA lysidine(34) synthetase TilS [Methylosoma difficile]